MAGGIDFNRGKFKELVLYFAQEAERVRDEGFGMVKLNKLLYYADFEAYRLLGHSITGEIYERQEYGPVARDLPIVLDELAAAGRLGWQQISRGEHTSFVPGVTDDPDAGPDLTQFPDDERKMMEMALRVLTDYGGKASERWSHRQSAGWNIAGEDGRTIDYETTFISTAPIPDEDVKRAKQYVRDRGWVKESV